MFFDEQSLNFSQYFPSLNVSGAYNSYEGVLYGEMEIPNTCYALQCEFEMTASWIPTPQPSSGNESSINADFNDSVFGENWWGAFNLTLVGSPWEPSPYNPYAGEGKLALGVAGFGVVLTLLF